MSRQERNSRIQVFSWKIVKLRGCLNKIEQVDVSIRILSLLLSFFSLHSDPPNASSPSPPSTIISILTRGHFLVLSLGAHSLGSAYLIMDASIANASAILKVTKIYLYIYCCQCIRDFKSDQNLPIYICYLIVSNDGISRAARSHSFSTMLSSGP